MAGGGEQKSLEETPTWAVFAVCAVFVVASLLVERGIKLLSRYLRKSKQKQLLHTLEQIKDELMLLGFISLSLTVFQNKIASLCMPERLNKIMLPCKYKASAEYVPSYVPSEAGHRRLLAAGAAVTCPVGKVQVISIDGLHQLHIFIFVMAVVHVLYSALTVLIGLWQVHRWKKWEVETQQYQEKCVHKALKGKYVVADFLKSRMRYKFLQSSKTGLHLDTCFYCFFRQFGKPICKSDYLVLRFGFIAHHELDSRFDFHSYIKRSMERDFKHVVGISAYLWAFVCIYLLVNIYGWFSYFWLAFVPTIMVLFVGAKLQLIITFLALEIRTDANKVQPVTEVAECPDAKGAQAKNCPAIRPSDKLFWFHKPRLLLYLVHFILFQNAFELAFFFWTLFTYGYSSCLVGRTWMVVVRILVGFFVQILCSASTLPLYALVTQLGSNMKLTVFKSESTGIALQGWAKSAKKRHSSLGHVHEPITPRGGHLGIVGLNKALDEHGHPVDIPLPGSNGTKQLHNGNDHHQVHHNAHGHHEVHHKEHDGNTHLHHVHPHHPDAHPQSQGTQLNPQESSAEADGSNRVEIAEQPESTTSSVVLAALKNMRRPTADMTKADEVKKP